MLSVIKVCGYNTLQFILSDAWNILQRVLCENPSYYSAYDRKEGYILDFIFRNST